MICLERKKYSYTVHCIFDCFFINAHLCLYYCCYLTPNIGLYKEEKKIFFFFCFINLLLKFFHASKNDLYRYCIVYCLIVWLSDCNSIVTLGVLIEKYKVDDTCTIVAVVIDEFNKNKKKPAYCYCLKMNRSNYDNECLKMNTMRVECSLDESIWVNCIRHTYFFFLFFFFTLKCLDTYV